MAGLVWIIFLLAISLPDCLAITNNKSSVLEARIVDGSGHCTSRLENALGTISTRRISSGRPASTLDLSGYALHQPLRSAPYDMYVTGMRVRVPGRTSWARVDHCRYDPSLTTLQTRLLFRDLAVTGSVKLYDEMTPINNPVRPTIADKCNMTLRMRRAGLGFTVVPSRGRAGNMAVSTAATFLEPQFVSVHAYGCRSPDFANRRADDGPEARDTPEDGLDLSQEIEDVFLRGVRSLLTSYMEKKLEPALRDTLMVNMGYSVSYGRR